jgi:hypothetical protein
MGLWWLLFAASRSFERRSSPAPSSWERKPHQFHVETRRIFRADRTSGRQRGERPLPLLVLVQGLHDAIQNSVYEGRR